MEEYGRMCFSEQPDEAVSSESPEASGELNSFQEAAENRTEGPEPEACQRNM